MNEPGTLTATARARPVAQAGRRRGRARVYGTATATGLRGGVKHVAIRPRAWARRGLARGCRLRVRIAVTFQPVRGGAPQTASTTVTAKGRTRRRAGSRRPS